MGLLIKGALDIFFPNFILHFSETYETITWNKLAPAIAQYDGKPGISFEDQLKFAEIVGIPQYNVVEGKPIEVNKLNYTQLENALRGYSSNVPH